MNQAELALGLAGLAAVPGAGAAWILARPQSRGVLGSRALEACLVGPVLVAVLLHGALFGGRGPCALAVLGWGALAVGAWRGRSCWRWSDAWVVLAIAIPTLAALVCAVVTVPLLGDPADLWAAKAAAFKVAGALDLTPLGTGEALARRNPFHPAGFPLLMVQGLAWLDRFEPTLCRLPSVYFLGALLWLVHRAVASVQGATWALLPTLAAGFLPPVFAQGWDGHADLAVGVLALAAWLVLLTDGSPVLAGALAGGAALLKLEGPAAVAIGALLLVVLGRWRALPWFLGVAVVFLSVPWLVRPSGVAGIGDTALIGLGGYLEQPRLLLGRVSAIVAAFVACVGATGALWLGLMGAMGLALVAGGRQRVAWCLLLAAFVWLLAVAYAYLRHPNFAWQVEVHHRRALVQVLPSLWAAGSLALGRAARVGGRGRAAEPPAPGAADQ